MKTFPSLIRKIDGFTIVEMVIAMAVLSVGIAGALTMMQSSARIQYTAKVNSDLEALHTRIITTLGKQENCTATFKNVTYPAPSSTTGVAIPAILQVAQNGTISTAVSASATAPSGAPAIFVESMSLMPSNELVAVYRRPSGAMGGEVFNRKISLPIKWDGTKIICSPAAQSLVDENLRIACLGNGGFYDATISDQAARCKRCPDGQYNKADPGDPLSCESLDKKACEILGSSVGYWDGSKCHTCPKAGDILKKVGTGPFVASADCKSSIDEGSLQVAMNCVAPNTASVTRNPDGTIIGQCVAGVPPTECKDERTDDQVKAEFCTGTEARDKCNAIRGTGTKVDPVACDDKLIFAKHSVKECGDAGGTVIKGPLGDGEKFCRFNDIINKNPGCKFTTGTMAGVVDPLEYLSSSSSSNCTAAYMTINKGDCPSGWTQYKNYAKWVSKGRYRDSQVIEYGEASCIPDVASKKLCKSGYFSEPNAYCYFSEKSVNFGDVAEPPCVVLQRKWVMKGKVLGPDPNNKGNPLIGPPECTPEDSMNAGSAGCNASAFGGWKIEDIGCY